MVKQACIYKILNTITNDCYIGGTTNIYNRSAEHKSLLRLHKHPSTRLQKAYDEYGEPAFRLEILELVDDFSTLEEREQYYCDVIQPTLCARTNVHDNSGVKMPEESSIKKSIALKGRVITEEHRRKISEANSGINSHRYGLPAHNRGVPMSDEQKIKVSRGKAKIDESTVIAIRKAHKDGVRNCDIARTFGVNRKNVQNIISGKSYKHLLGMEDSL